MSNEWVEWHRGYEGDQPHGRRLRVVQDRIRDALHAAPPGPIRVLSICAGDGRDLLGVLADHPRRGDVHGRLVDVTPELVAAGRAHVDRLGLTGIEFVAGDASTTDAYAGQTPADLVLACGIFGNITDDDVQNTVQRLPELCAPNATVLWTRGRFAPDLTPAIREWFLAAGFEELAFDSIPGTTASVGTMKFVGAPRAFRPAARLFTFLPKGERPADRARQSVSQPPE